MNLSKYLNWRNYYSFAKRQFYDFYFNSNDTHIVQTRYFGVEILVRANETVGKEIMLNRFELNELNYLKSVLTNHSVIIDIGANIGFFSLMLASVSKNNAVHAFEPIRLNADLIRLSQQINHLDNLTVNQSCVGDTDGFVEFSVASDSAFSSIKDSGRKREAEKITCASCKLDTYVKNANIHNIDFVKIDVEGAERIVLMGAKEIFKHPDLRPKLLMLELYDLNLKQFKTTVKEIIEIMSMYGYSAYILRDHALKSFDYDLHANKIYNVFFKSISTTNSITLV